MQAVLSIFAGVFALGAILGALDLISQDTTRSWIDASPASIFLSVSPGASEDVISRLSRMDEVAETEGDMILPIRSGFSVIYGSTPQYTPEKAEAAAEAMEDQLGRQGFTVSAAGVCGQTTVSPDEHFLQDTLDGVFLILIIMGVASLLLGLLLVYSTISAIISQQVSQIGVLKAIGASRTQILLVYFTIAFIYGLLAMVSALVL